MDRSLILPHRSTSIGEHHALSSNNRTIGEYVAQTSADSDSLLDVIDTWRLANKNVQDESSDQSISAADAVGGVATTAAGGVSASARSAVSCHTLVVVGSGRNALGISVPLSGCKLSCHLLP